MYPVKYHKATSIAEATAALSAGEDATILAGGQTLLATMKQHLAAPSDLVDIRGIADLNGVSVEGDTLTIGAATNHRDVAMNADVQKLCPALAELASNIGDPAVRNAGTIGGSLANNDPAADYPAAILALNATIVTNRREIAADDYFEGLFGTALDDGEIITAVKIKSPSKAAYVKFAQQASLFALVGVFVADGAGGVRVTVTGAGEDGVFRQSAMESALAASWSAGALEGVDASEEGIISDLHGSADYRAHLINVMAKRAVTAA